MKLHRSCSRWFTLKYWTRIQFHTIKHNFRLCFTAGEYFSPFWWVKDTLLRVCSIIKETYNN